MGIQSGALPSAHVRNTTQAAQATPTHILARSRGQDAYALRAVAATFRWEHVVPRAFCLPPPPPPPLSIKRKQCACIGAHTTKLRSGNGLVCTLAPEAALNCVGRHIGPVNFNRRTAATCTATCNRANRTSEPACHMAMHPTCSEQHMPSRPMRVDPCACSHASHVSPWIVSPRAGSRGTYATRSMLEEPTTTTSWCHSEYTHTTATGGSS